MESIKIVAIGDRSVGKTCLLLTYTTKKIPEGYCQTVFDHYAATVMIGGVTYRLGLFDMPEQDEFIKFRRLSYPFTEVFLICFSVVNPSSFQHVQEKWVPRIMHHFENPPFLLVGTKIDLRRDPWTLQQLVKNNQRPITTEQGERLAKEVNAIKYVECSSVTQQGVKDVFDEAILFKLNPPEPKP